MLECRMAMSSKGVMQQLEMSVDRQLLAEMVTRAVGVTTLIYKEYNDDDDQCKVHRQQFYHIGYIAINFIRGYPFA